MREWEAGRAVGENAQPGTHRAGRSRNSAEPGVQPQAAGSGNLQLLVSACACPSDPFCSRFSRGRRSLGRRRAGGRIAGSLVSCHLSVTGGGNKAELDGRAVKEGGCRRRGLRGGGRAVFSTWPWGCAGPPRSPHLSSRSKCQPR